MAPPTKPDTNDANAWTRLEFARRITTETFGFKVVEINTLAYEEGFPFPYNNFVFAVRVDRSVSQTPSLPKQPGTQPVPPDESTFVVRLPNPLSGYNDTSRVQNEVAALALAREALRPSLKHLVPRVYGWASAEHGEGWILQQHMPGEGLSAEFLTFDAQQKANVLGQMAEILACFQRFKLPSTINKYGGIGFDESGNYVSAPLSTANVGPFDTYQDFLRATITSELAQADRNPRVRGWRDHGIRDRLDSFVDRGLTALLRDVGSLDRVLVHADFTTDNILYDKSSGKLTALFDFDFAHVGSVAEEFCRSLGGFGRFPSGRDGNVEEEQLRIAMLQGFPQPLPTGAEDVDWIAATAWDDAIRERGLQRPATISTMSAVADIHWLSGQILPFRLCNEVVADNSTEEQLVQRKTDVEALLSAFLRDHGF